MKITFEKTGQFTFNFSIGLISVAVDLNKMDETVETLCEISKLFNDGEVVMESKELMEFSGLIKKAFSMIKGMDYKYDMEYNTDTHELEIAAGSWTAGSVNIGAIKNLIQDGDTVVNLKEEAPFEPIEIADFVKMSNLTIVECVEVLVGYYERAGNTSRIQEVKHFEHFYKLNRFEFDLLSSIRSVREKEVI